MNKSVYSLVLSDEIVQEIDRMAYEASASRSAMINQILAEFVRYTTPEKRMREVFSAIEHMLLGGVFEPQLQPSDSMFSLRSALDYKYNPSVKYSVELYKNARPLLGELRVSRSKPKQRAGACDAPVFQALDADREHLHRARGVRAGGWAVSAQAAA